MLEEGKSEKTGQVESGPMPHPNFLKRVIFRQCQEFVAAIQFLSVLPVPGSARLFRTDRAEAELTIGSLYFPLVGLLLGLILSLLAILSGPYLPPLVLAALLVVVSIWLTGGLHLDGLMDACDGLFGGWSRERKLEIMRDSRVGSFGVLGGVSIILLKFVLLASMSFHQLPLVFLLVWPASRWAMVLALYVFPSARATGLGAAVRQVVTTRRVVIATLLEILIAGSVGHLVGLCVLGMAALVAVGLGVWVTRSVGGLTGDVCGMIAEVGEVVCLLLLVVLQGV